MTARCRDCFTADEGAPARCRACGGSRLAVHDALESLTVAHLDCDAFYASIEKRDDPSLASRPVIVGGGKRGVVAAACYVARAYGVRSAMPMFKALKACPDAAVVKPSMEKYAAAGRQVRNILGALTPAVEPVSIDEAYLDLTGCEAVNGGSAALALMRAQAQIEREVGVTVSVGLSSNKLLAKIASDLDKPRGFAVISPAEAPAFLGPRPISILPGVGPAGAKALAAQNLRTIGDLQRADPRALAARLGPWAGVLHAFAHGRDTRPVDPEGERKTLSAETTFHEDLRSPAALEDRLWLLAERVATRARAIEIAGRTVTLKLKAADFRSFTRRRTLPEPTLLAGRIFAAAQPLLAAEADGRRAYRLIGVGLSDLSPAAEADRGDLLDAATPRRAAAEAAIAHARDRFGSQAVETGRSLRIRRERGES